MNRIVLFGPPGAGKGTQALRLADALDVPAISTGDIFRANIREGTDLGRAAQAYSDAGNLVPDALTNEMVADRLAQPDAGTGFLLDGYPRNRPQVDELDRMLQQLDAQLDVVVELTADPEELIRRMLKRAAEQGRSDDTEVVIRHRQALYLKETAPLADLYAERGLLVQVDGTGSMDEVTERLRSRIVTSV